MYKTRLFFIVMLFTLVGCTTLTTEEKEQKRNALDDMAKETIAALVKKDVKIQEKLDDSMAYAVWDMKITKVPVIGAGGGQGVFVSGESQQRVYFTVKRLDLGGGWGVRAFKVLLLVESQDVFDRLKDGTWEFQAGVEASAGSVSAEGSSSDLNKGFSMYVLSEAGASVTVTARAIRTKVNRKLTETP